MMSFRAQVGVDMNKMSIAFNITNNAPELMANARMLVNEFMVRDCDLLDFDCSIYLKLIDRTDRQAGTVRFLAVRPSSISHMLTQMRAALSRIILAISKNTPKLTGIVSSYRMACSMDASDNDTVVSSRDELPNPDSFKHENFNFGIMLTSTLLAYEPVEIPVACADADADADSPPTRPSSPIEAEDDNFDLSMQSHPLFAVTGIESLNAAECRHFRASNYEMTISASSTVISMDIFESRIYGVVHETVHPDKCAFSGERIHPRIRYYRPCDDSSLRPCGRNYHVGIGSSMCPICIRRAQIETTDFKSCLNWAL